MITTTCGIDVSKHQGNINWRQVKAAEIDFAIIRACFGWDNDSQIDPKYKQYLKGCQEAGVPFGFYHYSYAATPADAVKEAKFFQRVIAGAKPEYPVAFDFEEAFQVGGIDKYGAQQKGLPPAAQLEIIDAFMQEMECAGYYAVLYMSASALERLNRAEPNRIAKYDCWVAHVNTTKPMFTGSYGLWQYSWKGRVDGIAGDVDMNYGYKDYPALIKAAGLNGWSNPQPSPPTTEKPKEMLLNIAALQADGIKQIVIKL